VACVCEVDANRLAAAAETVKVKSGKTSEPSRTCGRLLDDKNVDAVFIARRPLARPRKRSCVDAREARLRRKPLLPQSARGATDGRCRSPQPTRRAGRHAVPQHRARDPGMQALAKA